MPKDKQPDKPDKDPLDNELDIPGFNKVKGSECK